MKTTIEYTTNLTDDEKAAVNAAATGCRACETLDEAEANLRALFDGWFVYRGGNHIALHRDAQTEERALLVSASYASEVEPSGDAVGTRRRISTNLALQLIAGHGPVPMGYKRLVPLSETKAQWVSFEEGGRWYTQICDRQQPNGIGIGALRRINA